MFSRNLLVLLAWAFCATLLLVAAPVAVRANEYNSALTFQVDAKDESCFYTDIQEGHPFKMEFEVVRGGLLDIRLQIWDPRNTLILDRTAYFNKESDADNEAEGKVEFKPTVSGTHKLCFDNTLSRWTPKVVSFFVHTTDAHGNTLATGSSLGGNSANPRNGVAMLQDLGTTVDSVIKISSELDTIETLQRHMRKREKSHREAVNHTNTRFQWLSILQSVIIIGLVFFQISYIRHWFGSNGASGAGGAFSRGGV